MRRVCATVAVVAAFGLACSDSPVGTSLRDENAGPWGSHVISNPACTVHWASGVSGNWFDSTKWSPAVVPGGSDVVCVDAAGAYTVTMNPANDATPVAVTGLTLGGGGANPTLTMAGADVLFDVTMAIDIATGATFSYNLTGGAKVSAGAGVTNAGTINVATLCGNCSLGNTLTSDLTNTGSMNITGLLTLDKVAGVYVNSGAITLAGGTGIEILASTGAASFTQSGGSVSAPTQAVLAMRSGTYTLSGGTIALSPSTQLPVVRLNGASLVLAASLAGAQEIAIAATSAGATSITGDVPSGTTLWITGPGQPGNSSITWNGSPVVDGIVRPNMYSFSGTNVTIAGSGTLVNNGAVKPKVVTPQAFHYAIDIENHGTFELNGVVYFEKAAGFFDNYGIVGAVGGSQFHVTSGATYRSHAGGTMASLVSLIINGGHLRGTGSVSTVAVTNGGTVDPGDPIGTLNVTGFSPDATGTLTIDVAGSQAGVTYDQLVVSGQATMNGTLSIVGTPASASCGLVYDVLLHSSAGGSGAFSTVTGLTPGAGHAFRTIYQNIAPKKVSLAGYDPTAKVSIGSNPLALAEGQPGSSYAVCLDHAPTSSVTVTPTPDAQLTAAPALVFTPSAWQMPQFITATAVDDAAIEPPHTGSVTHVVSSADASYNNAPVALLVANIADNDGSTDLDVKISKGPPPLTLNQVFTVGFRVTNHGPTISTGATVTFQPVGGFQYLGVVGASCTASASGLTCTLPGMASGANAVLTLTLKAAQRGTFNKTISVIAQQPDPASSNNTLAKTITVN
ncbi:MAG: hypothetical protein MNPFHGCM_00697 [Gemmatimonadaceae bacterium]|nr:hypothetical protein [Gemmatimonadaceae bacterium]